MTSESEPASPQEFKKASMPGASFVEVDLSGARFHNVSLRGARITEATLAGATIDADVTGTMINGLPLDELIDAEYLRRYPERALLKPTSPADYRKAFAMIQEKRSSSIEVLSGLSQDVLTKRTDSGDWSPFENFRHLLFAEELWPRMIASGEDFKHSSEGQPPTFFEERAREHGSQFEKSFTLDEVLAELHRSHTKVKSIFDALVDETLKRGCKPRWNGTVAQALLIYLDHEWWHHKSIAELVA